MSVRTLHAEPAMAVRLAHYGAGERMPEHSHEVHQISFLLAGEIREDVDGRQRRLSGPCRGHKPRGLKHANIYGPQGALVLSLNIFDNAEARDGFAPPADWNWFSSRNGGEHERALMGLILAGCEDSKGLSWQLLGCGLAEERSAIRIPPAWLRRVRDRLNDETETFSIDQAANDAGVHPVYLARAFTRHYDAPPSLYRQRVRVAHAIRHIRKGVSLVESAALAGFSDQSHLTRALKREIGVTPGRLRSLFHPA